MSQSTLTLVVIANFICLNLLVLFSQEKRTNFGNLYIKKTEFKADADFRCEVLAENDFNTAIQIKKVRVYCKFVNFQSCKKSKYKNLYL